MLDSSEVRVLEWEKISAPPAAQFHHRVLSHCRPEGGIWVRPEFFACQFLAANIQDTSWLGARFWGGEWIQTTFVGGYFHDVQWSEGVWNQVHFTRCIFQGAAFRNPTLFQDVRFERCIFLGDFPFPEIGSELIESWSSMPRIPSSLQYGLNSMGLESSVPIPEGLVPAQKAPLVEGISTAAKVGSSISAISSAAPSGRFASLEGTM